MKEKRWKKGGLAVILAAVLATAGFHFTFLYAANGIDTSKKCSLTLNTADTGAFSEEFSTMQLNAKLYRIAAVNEAGKYTSLEAFQSLDMEKLTEEGNWESAAGKAAELAEGIEPDTSLQIVEGTGKAEGLEQGMYLVLVEESKSEWYEYHFNPYLVALPDNLYHHSGDLADDQWQYDVTGGIKPEQSPRYGSLKIRKTLSAYNTSLGEVTFVFQIEGVDKEGNMVYSNVISTTHSAAGTKEAVVENLPAGIDVTVTEVYSGASYRLQTEPEKTVSIAADKIAEVEFSNTYDDKLTPGYGVTNHFDYDEDEGWKWSQQKDNSTGNE